MIQSAVVLCRTSLMGATTDSTESRLTQKGVKKNFRHQLNHRLKSPVKRNLTTLSSHGLERKSSRLEILKYYVLAS